MSEALQLAMLRGPRGRTLQRPRFTPAEVDGAHEEWGCNCGPAAVAAICNLTLAELRPHLGNFEAKRYTNPTLMTDILGSLAVNWRPIGKIFPTYGLARIQWEGPWTKPGVPMRVRYRYTHWVGVFLRGAGDLGIFDVNMMDNGTGWGRFADWRDHIVPWLLSQYPGAQGWHVTHGIELDV